MFARHDLVWLTDAGWELALDTAPQGCHDAIDLWRMADWPAIVRRTDADLAKNQLSIGIALPPGPVDGLKRRIALRVLRSEVKKCVPPLPLNEVVEAAPEQWRTALAALHTEALREGLTVRTYGSLALQALTGQQYVTAKSDIDLLMRPTSLAQLYRGIDLLRNHEARLPLDGEVLFPGGRAVAWKELSGAMQSSTNPRVLVKEMGMVSLATTTALFATLEGASCKI